MLNFEFYNPVKLVFGKDVLLKLASLIPSTSRVLFLYGGGSIKKNGVYEIVKTALSKHKVVEFSGIEANPEYQTCKNAITLSLKENCDFVLAVGGGSVLDAAKLIAAGAAHPEHEPWDLVLNSKLITKALPIGTILTLPATGSEMNVNSVISRKETQEKLGWSSLHVYPKFSLLDPQTTYSLPHRQIANGIVDSFVHVCEQYLSADVDAEIQSRWAEGVLLTLLEYGPRAMKETQNYEVRANLMWACTVALNGSLSVGVPGDWSTHMIGHELTAFYGIDHARTLAVVMPGVWNFCRKNKEAKLLRYAKYVWGLNQGDKDVLIDEAIARTVLFFESLGVGTTLKDYQLGNDAVEAVSHRLGERGVKLGEHQDLGEAEIRKILSSRLG